MPTGVMGAVSSRIERGGDQDLFRHQLITFLTKQGIISATLQLLGGRATDRSLATHRDLTLSASKEPYWEELP